MSRRADKPAHCTTLTITVSSYPQKPVSSFTCWGFFCYHLTSYSWSPFYRKETIPPVLSPPLSFWAILAFSTICIVQGWASINLPIFNSVSTHVISLFFSYSFVSSDDVHTSLPIPLSSGSLMHEQAPRLCSLRYSTSHLSPLPHLYPFITTFQLV